MNWAKTTARGYKKHLSFGIWCDLYKRFYGSWLDIWRQNQSATLAMPKQDLLSWSAFSSSMNTCTWKPLDCWLEAAESYLFSRIDNSIFFLYFEIISLLRGENYVFQQSSRNPAYIELDENVFIKFIVNLGSGIFVGDVHWCPPGRVIHLNFVDYGRRTTFALPLVLWVIFWGLFY